MPAVPSLAKGLPEIGESWAKYAESEHLLAVAARHGAQPIVGDQRRDPGQRPLLVDQAEHHRLGVGVLPRREAARDVELRAGSLRLAGCAPVGRSVTGGRKAVARLSIWTKAPSTYGSATAATLPTRLPT